LEVKELLPPSKNWTGTNGYSLLGVNQILIGQGSFPKGGWPKGGGKVNP